MKPTKSVSEQQDTLPIPLASVVIDVRTVKDDLLETLRLEIENLASEKQERNVIHWQHLADFTAFKALTPMGKREIDELWTRMKMDSNSSTNSDGVSLESNHTSSPTRGTVIGARSRRPILQFGQRDNYPPFYEDDEEEQQEQQEDGGEQTLNEEYRDCENLIDQVRNERHNAISDLGTTGKRGYNTKDPRVHVIFITDARQPDSLSSASVYAAYLKQYYRNKLAHLDHDPVLMTSFLCLNHVNTTKAPEALIQRLRWIEHDQPWEHINTLILAEKYREDAGRQDETMQTYVAELLLYSLLIMLLPDLEGMEFVPDPRKIYPDKENVKERIGLPPNTYLFGLSAVEHSARWGRRFLSTTLGLHTIEQLQSPMYGEEGTRTKDVVDNWLSRWLASIQKTIPANIPLTFPAVNAFDHANAVAHRGDSLFMQEDSGRDIGQRSIQRIQQYTSALQQTYYLENTERDAIQDETANDPDAASPTFTPTLQDAVNNIDPILSYVARQRDNEDTPFMRALHDAQRVLSHRDFFLGSQGAVSRAKLQLEELSIAISKFQSKTRPTNLIQQRESLEQLSKNRIADLQDHIESFPFLRAVPWLILPIMWISLLILAFFSIVLALDAVAWLYRLADAIGGPSFLNFLNSDLAGIPYLSIANLILAILLIALLLVFFYFPLRLLNRRRASTAGATARRKNAARDNTAANASLHPTALAIEFLFIGLLIIAALFGMGVSLSLPNFTVNTYSYGLISWLSWLPFWSYLLALIAVVLAIAELVHYSVWRGQLIHMRAEIVEEMVAEQQETVRMVQEYHTSKIALDILLRAELTNGQGGKGKYYERIEQLSTHLDNIAETIKMQQHVARNRLTPPPQQATLLIRKELLDVNRLATHSKRLEQSIQNDPFELRELANVLLRIMGTESPEVIERQLRDQDIDQPFLVQSYQDRKSLRQLELLMTVATAVALRLSTTLPESDMVEPLATRSEEISYATDIQTSLQALIHKLRERVRKLTIDVDSDLYIGQSQTLDADAITVQALMMWTLVLWMHKNTELEDILQLEDVTSVLLRTHDPKTVRDLLGTRLNPSGRTSMKRWIGDLYVLTPPTTSGRKFIQSMDSRLRDSHIVASPDTERLIMLYFQHHVTPPRMVIQEVEMPQIGPSTTATNGTAKDQHTKYETNTVVDGNIREAEQEGGQNTSDYTISNGHSNASRTSANPVSPASSTNGHTGDITTQNTVLIHPQSVPSEPDVSAQSDTSPTGTSPTLILDTTTKQPSAETNLPEAESDTQGESTLTELP